MIEKLSKVRRNGALAVLAVLVIWFSWTVRSVLNPLILGYLLAYIVHPMVTRLEVRGWRRRPAVNFIFVNHEKVVWSMGLYVDELVRSADGWRIKSRKIKIAKPKAKES